MIRFRRPKFLQGTLGLVILGGALLLIGGGGYALFFGGAGPAATVNSAALSKGLVGWWKMDGNIRDSTPYGTVCNSQFFAPAYTADRKGRANSAFTISSAKLGFDCGQPTALQVTNVTVSAWVNPSSYNTSGDGIESYGGIVQFFFTSSGFLKFQVHDSTNTPHAFISPSSYATGNWYHVAATYDGSTVVLYVNGTAVLTTSYTGGIGANHYGDSGNDFLLSNYSSDSTTEGFLGALDDIRYYNRALSAAEITALYKQYDTSTKTDTGEVGLVGWWKMQGNAKDATSNNNNGTLGGVSVPQSTGTGAAGETTGISLAWPSATTAGNTLIAVLTTNNGHTFTAPAGWTTLAHVTGQGGYYIFEIANSSSRSGTETFTNADGINDDTGLWLLELSGVDATTPIDIQQTFSSTSASTKAVLGPATVGPNAGIAIAIASGADGSGSTGAITTSGWTTTGQQRGGVGYKFVGGSSIVNPTFTNSSEWQGLLLSFNTAAAGHPSLIADRKGRTNGAYSFNGSSQYISIPNFSKQITSSTAMTISGWVKPPNNPGHSGYFGLRNDTNADFYVMQLSGTNNLECRYRGSNGTASTAGTVSVTPGVWQMVTLVYDGSNATCYVNAVGGTATAASGSISNGAVNLDIGAVSNTAQHFLNGSVADVRFYKRALSTTEISNLYKSYNSGIALGGDGISGGINLQKGLMGYWPLNDGSTTMAKDATPYSDNGTVNGATPTTDRKNRANSAYSFNGTSNYINVANSTALQMSNLVSLSAWVYLTTYTGHVDAVAVKGQSGVTWDYGLVIDGSGKLCFRWTTTDQCTSTILPLNQWTQVAVTTDNSTVWYYINGSQDSSATAANTIHTTTNPLDIGFAEASNNYFAGKVDDVRIYNRALNATEVRALYTEYQ